MLYYQEKRWFLGFWKSGSSVFLICITCIKPKNINFTRTFSDVKARVGGLIAGLIAILSVAAAIAGSQSEVCGDNGQTYCSPVWGPPVCATAYVYGCWYSGSEYLHKEYHSASAVAAYEAYYGFRGYWCSANFYYFEYDDRGKARGDFSVSQTYYVLVHLAETYVAVRWWMPGWSDNWYVSVSIGAGGWV